MANKNRRSKLRGRSFIGHELKNATFIQADLRGAKFSKASLEGADFREAKMGIAPSWFLIIIVSLLFATALTGLIISYASVLVTIPLEDSPFYPAAEIFISFLVAIVLMILMTRQGLGSAFGAWSIALAAMIPTIIALAQEEQVATGYIIFAVIVTALGVAGIIAGIITGSIIIAVMFALSNRIIFLLVAPIACLSSFLGMYEGIGTASTQEPLVWPFSIGLTLLAFTASLYIGHRAGQEDPKFKLIQSLSIFLVILKGTQFEGADLTEANFTQANLQFTNFSYATLTRTCWFQSKGLYQVLARGTYLENSSIKKLVVSKQGQDQNFDYQNLRGLNLQGANLADTSFIGADLSNANLQEADLSRAKLAKTQLYNTRLNQACLTGANIQDWAIALDTQFDQVKCDYIYMHLPTAEDQDPYRKPDDRDEIFQPGDFADFITPIIKTLDLYRQQHVDLRQVATTYKTIDLFHHEGIDPSAAAIALQRLTELHPDAGIEVVALEGRGNDKVRLQARVSNYANPSELSKEYFEQYSEIKELAYGDLQALLRGIEEKDSRIRSLENMVTTAIQQKTFYVETYQNMGDTVTEKRSIEFNAGGDISGISGIVGGDVSGVMNLGTISGNVTNSINQLPDNDSEKGELKNLLQQLQAAIEQELNLEPEDKAEALEQVQTLAQAGQKPEDSAMQKAAKTAMKILKGTTAGLSETTNLVTACNTLLPAISGLLLLL